MPTMPTMREVEVTSDIDEPPDSIPDIPHIVEVVADAVSAEEWNVSVLLCDDSRIRELNRQYRQIDRPTDVLSFGPDDALSGTLEGDIAISVDSVSKNAEEWSETLQKEFTRVVVHALLHLHGFEHEGVTLDSQDASTHPMLGLQERIVKELTSDSQERTR